MLFETEYPAAPGTSLAINLQYTIEYTFSYDPRAGTDALVVPVSLLARTFRATRVSTLLLLEHFIEHYAPPLCLVRDL